MESVNETILAHAARRARYHPTYMGWVFRRYQEIENRSEDALAQHLTISPLDLQRLSLCLRPRIDHFAEDVRHISDKFSVDVATLAQIIRLVESVEVFAVAQTDTVSSEAGLLMAARTRKKPRTPQEKQKSDDKQPKS